MTCPVCGSKTKVINSRPYSCEGIWRRRECLVCKHRFATMEEEIELLNRQQTEEEKLKGNLQKVHKEMKQLIKISKDERSSQIVRNAALNSYSTIVTTLELLGLPITEE